MPDARLVARLGELNLSLPPIRDVLAADAEGRNRIRAEDRELLECDLATLCPDPSYNRHS